MGPLTLGVLVWLVPAAGLTQPAAGPAPQPPPDSPPLLRAIQIRSTAQQDALVVDPQTYLYYIETRPSRPSDGVWVPYTDAIEASLREDYRRLWNTGFLEDLTLEVVDVPYPNGAVGKLAVFDLEERPRVKIVDYTGSDKVEQSKIDETLKERNAVIRNDAFLDRATIRRVAGIVRGLYAEKGYQSASVTPEIKPVAGGPKIVHLTFHVSEGPRIQIRDVEFVGNTRISDRALAKRMKENKSRGFLSFITGDGTYKEAKFEEDAESVVEYYRDQGYIAARVGQPELRTVEESKDGKTRWVELRIPVTEGERYRVGAITFEGQSVVKEEALRPLFKLDSGDWYNERHVRKGLEKARSIFGAGGYFEFTGYPDLQPRAGGDGAPPLVDVTMRMQPGKQYFVNRITFVGNTTTRDNVIRRELLIHEGGVFNTEALKVSIRRLNQLGYFKPLEGEAVSVEKAAAPEGGAPETNEVDIKVKVEEQNRNQLTFGAGVSGLDGIFVSGSFATTNFLGRGETAQISVQTGARSSYYQLALTEPYVFDRPITAGVELFSRKNDYLLTDGELGYSEVRRGGGLTGGVAVGRFTRAFVNYVYEVIDTAIRDDLLEEGAAGNAGDPVFNLFRDEGRHIESRMNPSVVHNTVDNPYMPRTGKRLSGSFEIAGGPLGGTIDYIRPNVEGVLYVPVTRRMAAGLRAEAGWIRPYGETTELPYYRRFFLGGETQIRGVDVRTVGPFDAQNRALGGDKFLLFNAEYYFDIAGPVRVLAFHDAGQAFSEAQRLDLRQLRTSSGFELRVFMPVLNVPFRLIYAWNIYRDSFQPPTAFKFAVGTTF